MKKLIVPLLSAVIVVSIIFAGCMPARGPTPSEEGPIRIACLTMLTGTQTHPQGTQMLNGYSLAIDEFNEAGGLNGRMAEAIYIHEGYRVEEVLSNYKRAIALEPHAIVCGMEAGLMDAGAPLLRDSGIISVHCYGAAIKMGTPGFYDRGFKINNFCAQDYKAVKALVEERGYTSVSYLGIDCDYCRQAVGVMEGFWPPGGPVEVRDVEYYTYGEVEVEMELARLVAGDPDLLVLGVWGETVFANTVKKLDELGYEGAVVFDIEVIQHEYAADEEMGPLVDGMYGLYSWMMDPAIPESWEFGQKIIERAGITPDSMCVMAYTGTKCVLEAMKHAGTADDPDKIAAAMFEIDFMTVWGSKFWLFPGGLLFIPSAILVQAQDGKLVPAYNIELGLEDYNEPYHWYDDYLAAGGGK